MAHGEQYAAEFGWDTSSEALVADRRRLTASHEPGREGAWIAEHAGRRVAVCSAAQGRRDRPTADPAGRRKPGLGLGRAASSTAPSRSPARPGTAGWCCGPTIRSPPRARSTSRGLPAGRRGAPPQLRRRPHRAELRADALVERNGSYPDVAAAPRRRPVRRTLRPARRAEMPPIRRRRIQRTHRGAPSCAPGPPPGRIAPRRIAYARRHCFGAMPLLITPTPEHSKAQSPASAAGHDLQCRRSRWRLR